MNTNTDNMIQTYQATAEWNTLLCKNRTEYSWVGQVYCLTYVHSSGDYYACYYNEPTVIWTGTNIAAGMNACYKHLAERREVEAKNKDKQATEHIFFEYKGSRYKISISYPIIDTLFYTVYVYARDGYRWQFEHTMVRASDVLEPWSLIEYTKAYIDKG